MYQIFLPSLFQKLLRINSIISTFAVSKFLPYSILLNPESISFCCLFVCYKKLIARKSVSSFLPIDYSDNNMIIDLKKIILYDKNKIASTIPKPSFNNIDLICHRICEHPSYLLGALGTSKEFFVFQQHSSLCKTMCQMSLFLSHHNSIVSVLDSCYSVWKGKNAYLLQHGYIIL